MKKFMRFISSLLCLSFFFLLLIYSDTARLATISGLKNCYNIIIPALFPFFVVSGVLTKLGIVSYIGKILSPIMTRIFKISPATSACFLISICGGYPLGAATLADLYRQDEISLNEATRVLPFCNNTGPAFIISAIGISVFHSLKIGVFLYIIHILSALTLALILAPKNVPETSAYRQKTEIMPFHKAFTASVKTATTNIISVCSFVVAFTILCAILSETGVMSYVILNLSALLPLEVSSTRALVYGFLELGTGISVMLGLDASAINLAIASFVVTFGSISVHFQTASVLASTDIKTAQHTVGRFICGLISAVYVLIFAKFIL